MVVRMRIQNLSQKYNFRVPYGLFRMDRRCSQNPFVVEAEGETLIYENFSEDEVEIDVDRSVVGHERSLFWSEAEL